MQRKWTYTKENIQCYGNNCKQCFPCKKLYTEQRFVLVSMDILKSELAEFQMNYKLCEFLE